LIADLEIDHDIQLNLYRILQEQLRNIVKYAHCKHIGVELLVSKHKLKMRIWDDGVGFEMDNFRGGIGISNMKRRTELFQGDFDIHSNPGEGCEVIIEIPVKTENVIRKKANSGSSVPELK
jgi:signal transduction histidine kinase